MPPHAVRAGAGPNRRRLRRQGGKYGSNVREAVTTKPSPLPLVPAMHRGLSRRARHHVIRNHRYHWCMYGMYACGGQRAALPLVHC